MARLPQRVTWQQVSDDGKSFTERSGTVWSRAAERVDQLKAPKYWVHPDDDLDHPIIVGTPGKSFPGLPVQHALFGPETQPATGLVCLSSSSDREQLRARFYGEFGTTPAPETTPDAVEPVPQSTGDDHIADQSAAEPEPPRPAPAAEPPLSLPQPDWLPEALPERLSWLDRGPDGTWTENTGTVWSRADVSQPLLDYEGQFWVLADGYPGTPVLIGPPSPHHSQTADVPDGALIRPYEEQYADTARKYFIKQLAVDAGLEESRSALLQQYRPYTGERPAAAERAADELISFTVDGVAVDVTAWEGGHWTWEWDRKFAPWEGTAHHELYFDPAGPHTYYQLFSADGEATQFPAPPGLVSPAEADLAVRAMIATGRDTVAENDDARRRGANADLHVPRHLGHACGCDGCAQHRSEAALLPASAVAAAVDHLIATRPADNPHRVALEYTLPLYGSTLTEVYRARATNQSTRDLEGWADGIKSLVDAHVADPDAAHYALRWHHHMVIGRSGTPSAEEQQRVDRRFNEAAAATLADNVRPLASATASRHLPDRAPRAARTR